MLSDNHDSIGNEMSNFFYFIIFNNVSKKKKFKQKLMPYHAVELVMGNIDIMKYR